LFYFHFYNLCQRHISVWLKKYFLKLLSVIALIVENARAIRKIQFLFIYCQTLDCGDIDEA